MRTDRLLREPGYLAFPFRMSGRESAAAERAAHVRQCIEQVLFTAPGERVFRPHFGAGAIQLVFEPAGALVEELTRNRLRSSLAEALEGEVDPRTLEIEVEAPGPELRIVVSYELTTLGQRERQEYSLGGSDG